MPENPASPTEETTEVDSSRRNFLRMTSMGGVGAAALFLAACGSDDNSDSTSTSGTSTGADSGSGGSNSGDIAVVNYALTLEYLEADFYEKVIDAKVLKSSEQDVAKVFGEQEAEHVQALTKTVKDLGGTPATKPTTKFDVSDRMKVLELAATVENLGANAYLGAAGLIKSPDVLAAALSIHSVEARHAAALNTLLGKGPTPDGAFAKPADMKTVLAAVKPFIA